MSKRQATATLANGEMVIVEYDPTSGGDPADSIIRRVREAYPDQQIVEVADGNAVMNRQIRDAIATRSATIDDLQAIAQSFDNVIPEEDADAWQQWIDYAADNPEVRIPDAINTAPIRRGQAVIMGAAEGAANVFANTLPNARAGFSTGTNPIMSVLTRIPYDALTDVFRRQPEVVAAQEQRGGYYTGGRVAGEIAASAPFVAAGGGGVSLLGRGVTRIAGAPRAVRTLGRVVENVGRSATTGGMGVRAVTPAAVRSGAPVAASFRGRAALRATGGGLSGVGGGALTDSDDLLVDGLIGGTIPFGATMLRRGAGATYDLFAGRFGDARAAEIFRNLIAENATQIVAALREAPANARANVAQFLAERDLATPELMAATRAVTASPVGRPLQDVAENRAAGQTELLNTIRGGETGTEAVAATREARTAARNATDPQRAEALFQADIGRTRIIPAEREAERLDALAAEINNSDIVRRMRGLEGRSREQLDVAFQNPEFFTLDGPMARTGEIADQAGRRADEGIEQQLGYRDAAAAQRQIADNLRAQGLSPLNIAGVVGNLRAAARDAQYVNPARYNVLTSFANNLANRARRMGGVVDASGLYELRKGMNDEIASLLGGSTADPSALRRRTAELVGEIKPLIDDAIEGAGGRGWREYLDNFTRRMTEVERGEFGRRLADLPEDQLENVLAGRNPDFVSDFFGPGRFDINAELTDVQRPAANALLNQFRADRDVANLGMRELSEDAREPVIAGINARVRDMFQPGARNAFMRGLSRMAAGAPGIYGGGAAADQLAREFSQTMRENAMARLAPALANPAAALRLMPVRSANAMTAGAFDRLPPTAQAYASQSLQQLMNPPAPRSILPNEEGLPPGQVFVGFQTGSDGLQYPVYRPVEGR
jgi:hypothetical protein